MSTHVHIQHIQEKATHVRRCFTANLASAHLILVFQVERSRKYSMSPQKQDRKKTKEKPSPFSNQNANPYESHLKQPQKKRRMSNSTTPTSHMLAVPAISSTTQTS